ncbi:protein DETOXIFICATION 16 isoform X1 [Oryza sativa Japonica Group]|uniref:protein DETOXIFICATION 16 isoform X1 n=1 Tax=Oryza sativa subsp. japonica TaxID=39947 RepID=UPI000775498F|nr:protein DETOXIFICATION 16 isoform X1 [Oryza sativa Japonica Group]
MDTSTTSIASEIGEMKTPPENMVINKASAAEEAPVVVAGDEDDDGEAGLGLREEVKKQLWLAGPLVAGALLRYVIQMISVMFVGHLGELPLAGASMANSFTTVTGFSLLLGMASALDTLCGQAFGAQQYHLLGIYKQRAMLLLTAVSVPLAVVWFYTGDILRLFGQEADIAAEAGTYARWMIPALFAYGLLHCQIRFLQTQNVVLPVMAAAGATALCHLLVCWVLVYAAGMGNRGAALSNAVSYWINVAILAVYVRVSSSCKKTWTGFSTEAFRDALGFFRLAVPSALMVCLEMWSYEILVLLSGRLPNPKLQTSVLSISLNTASLVWMIPFGLGSAISTRVSNELGAGRPHAACLAVRVSVFMAISEGLVIGLVLISVRNIWGHAYSNEEEVVKYVGKVLLVISVSNFFDGIQCVLSGVARGCGWQKIGACVNLGAYYIVGIPSAYLIAFILHLSGMVHTLDYGLASPVASWCKSCYSWHSPYAQIGIKRRQMRSIEPSILLFLQIPQHELDGDDCYVSKLGDYFLRPKK